MKQLKIVSLLLFLCAINLAYASSAVFLITPSQSAISLRSDGTAVVQWTVTNNTNATTNITIDPSYPNNPLTITSVNDSCSSTLAPSASCTFTTLVEGNVQAQTGSYALTPKICGFDRQLCSVPVPAVQVNYVTVQSPAYAYIGSTGSTLVGGPLGNGSLIPINASSNALGTALDGLAFGGDDGVTVSLDGKTIYASGAVAPSTSKIGTPPTQTLYIISSVTRSAPQLLATLDLPLPPGSADSRMGQIGSDPHFTYLALTPDNKTVYVSSSGGYIYKVDVEDPENPVLTSIITLPVGATIGSPILMGGMVLNSTGRTLYVAYNSVVYAIDTATSQIEEQISTENPSTDMVISPDGNTLYVTYGAASNAISAIDTHIFAVSSTILAGAAPLGMAISPDGAKLYVTNSGENTVSVIDLSNDTLETIAIESASSLGGIAIAPNGTKAFVMTDSGVAIIDLSNNTVTSQEIASTNLYQFGNFVG